MISRAMKKLWGSIALVMVGLCVQGRAQSFTPQANRLAAVSVDGLWRFHTGDDPAWAGAGFDDSGWPLLKSNRPWTRQGYKGYRGVAWYRFQVTLPAEAGEASLLLPQILTSFEVFADGQRIGVFGKMPPKAAGYIGGGDYQMYALPAAGPAPATARKVEIAIRVWDDGLQGPGGPQYGGAMVGASEFIRNQQRLMIASSRWSQTGTEWLALLQTLACAGALILFLLRRSEDEYLWFSLMMLTSAIGNWVNVSFAADRWNIDLAIVIVSLTQAVNGLVTILFYRKLFHPRSVLWMWIVAASFVLAALVGLVALAAPSAMSEWFRTLLISLLGLPINLWTIAILVSSVRKNSVDARLLVVPVILDTSVQLLSNTALITSLLGWQHKFNDYILLTREPFEIELHQVTAALFLLALFGILILRFTRTRAQEEQYATEVEGARSVQQFLIPDDLPTVAGFAIQSDYRPAREVGGDFFQVIPAEDGSVLVVVGDVAGKGLQAGMLATLLVGAARTAASFTGDPAGVLGSLNDRLCDKGHATCLVLRVEPEGAAILVNAGHLPPYLNGVELPMEGALPLGTIAGLEFPVLSFQIRPGDTLTLMSDGIVEAQKPDGELFGFERIAEHLKRSTSAASLGLAAQEFGQEDDITVLTIQRLG
jgi:sigma-B regulation protein RsbU (phosphoserine phosphatase)